MRSWSLALLLPLQAHLRNERDARDAADSDFYGFHDKKKSVLTISGLREYSLDLPTDPKISNAVKFEVNKVPLLGIQKQGGRKGLVYDGLLCSGGVKRADGSESFCARLCTRNCDNEHTFMDTDSTVYCGNLKEISKKRMAWEDGGEVPAASSFSRKLFSWKRCVLLQLFYRFTAGCTYLISGMFSSFC